jgi:hypothetical protein
LTCDLSLAALKVLLNPGVEKVGVTYRGAGSPIVDGFAFCDSGLTVYGVAPLGSVKTIALVQNLTVSQSASLIDLLKMLCRSQNLDLVDWCRCARVTPESANFEALLGSAKT